MALDSPDTRGSPASVLAHLRCALFAVLGACAFGGQQVFQRLNDEHGVGSANAVVGATLGCLLIVLVVWSDMYFRRDKLAANWYQRYKATSGMLVGQITVMACFWVFNFDIVGLIVAWGCGPCQSFFHNNFTLAAIYKYTFWSHVGACIPIAVLGPLQFFEKLRKYRHFLIHRWFGRILLLDSLVHQGAVSGMVLMGMVNSNDWPYWLYYSALGVLNIYAWIAIVIGGIAAIQKKMPTHGEYMHRLGAMWFAIVVAFRLFRPLTRIISERWEDAMTAWAVVFFCIGTVEIYLRKSGRFDPVAPLPQVQCPFTQS